MYALMVLDGVATGRCRHLYGFFAAHTLSNKSTTRKDILILIAGKSRIRKKDSHSPQVSSKIKRTKYYRKIGHSVSEAFFMDRVCVFVDGSNFYFGLKRNNQNTRVDYYEFSKAITGPDRRLVRTYYYNSAYDSVLSPDQHKSQQPFLDSLSKTPYLELRMGRLVPNHDGGYKERGAGIKLASDIVYYAARDFYDTAIVITDDTDLAVALSHVKEMGRQVELGLFHDSQPRELMIAADRTVPLEEVLEKFASKIFPEVPEENIGNRIEDKPVKTRRTTVLK